MRMIGKDCIQRRIKAIENGEETPSDLLTHILQSAGMQVNYISHNYIFYLIDVLLKLIGLFSM